MTVKKFYYLLPALLGFAATSCQKEPVISDLQNDYLVYTAGDPAINFAEFNTYYLPDSILLIGNSDKMEYWKDENAQQIIRSVANNMTARNFTRIDERAEANLGLQLSYVKRVVYFVGHENPYWWWDYPYYWAPDYWGDWTGWHYPYSIGYYTYKAGSLLIEMVNPDAGNQIGKKLPVVWSSFIGGLLTESEQMDLTRMVNAVDQAFAQSPAVKK